MKISPIWSILLVALFLVEIAIAINVPVSSGHELIKRAPPRSRNQKTTGAPRPRKKGNARPGKKNPNKKANNGNRVNKSGPNRNNKGAQNKPGPSRNTKGAQNKPAGPCKPISVPASVKLYCGYNDPKPAPGAVKKPRPEKVTFSATQINSAMAAAMAAAKAKSGKYPAKFSNEDRTKPSKPLMFPGESKTGLKEFPIYAPGDSHRPGAFRIVYHQDPVSNNCKFIGITEHPLSSSTITIACMNTLPPTRRFATIKKSNSW